MKMRINARILGLIGSLSLGVFGASADLEVSASVQIHAKADFYTPLSPYGGWVEIGSYGRCWRPAHVAVEWRPYCYGQWVWTDCGWYWESDEPWAWACYHYGWWVDDPVYGWVWAPGVEWGPAWVSWRAGGDFVGWAPLPPPGVVSVHRPEPSLFVFVSAGHFADPIRPSAVIVNNTTVINKTTEINDIKRETRTFAGTGPQQVVVNRGPDVAMVQKASGKPIAVTPIHDMVKRTPNPVSTRNDQLRPTGPAVPNGQGQTKSGFNQPGTPGAAPHAPGRGEPGSRRGEDQREEHSRGHDKG